MQQSSLHLTLCRTEDLCWGWVQSYNCLWLKTAARNVTTSFQLSSVTPFLTFFIPPSSCHTLTPLLKADISCFRWEFIEQVFIRWQEEMVTPILTGSEVLFLSNCVSVCQRACFVPSQPEWEDSSLSMTCLISAYWKPTLWFEIKPTAWKI